MVYNGPKHGMLGGMPTAFLWSQFCQAPVHTYLPWDNYGMSPNLESSNCLGKDRLQLNEPLLFCRVLQLQRNKQHIHEQFWRFVYHNLIYYSNHTHTSRFPSIYNKQSTTTKKDLRYTWPQILFGVWGSKKYSISLKIIGSPRVTGVILRTPKHTPALYKRFKLTLGPWYLTYGSEVSTYLEVPLWTVTKPAPHRNDNGGKAWLRQHSDDRRRKNHSQRANCPVVRFVVLFLMDVWATQKSTPDTKSSE